MSLDTSIRVAQPSDLEKVKGLLDLANDYAAERSAERQWTTMDVVYEQLRQQINNGECYLLNNMEQKVCAAICLSETDSYMWGDEGKDGMALYLHKLMKDPAIAPHGAGRQLMAFGAQEALRRGKKVLRCDTKQSQEHLVDYYLKLGFAKIRLTTYASNGKTAFLMQANPEDVLWAVAKAE